MTTLNSGNIVSRPNTTIDPNFALPPGVGTVSYLDTDDHITVTTEDDNGVTVSITYDDVYPMPVLTDTTEIDLQPPLTATVAGQTIYIAPDGRYAVDVNLDVEDIFGVTSYDVRVSKV